MDVRVESQSADETWPGGDAVEAVTTLARRKLAAVGPQELPVVVADTVVVLENTPLGKPASREDAVATLRALSGKRHEVLTGVGLRVGDRERAFCVSTSVWFRGVSEEEIERYVDSGECFDKAGSYGIQSGGAVLVDRVEGSYTNVVGLPLKETIEALEAML